MICLEEEEEKKTNEERKRTRIELDDTAVHAVT